MNLQLSLCQNDSNGEVTDNVIMLTIEMDGEIVATFETTDLLPRKIKINDRLIELSNGTIKHSGVRKWAGNIHWNTYDVIDYYALGFIQLLQLSKEWSCTQAWEPIFEKFKNGDTITGFDIDLKEDVQPTVVNKNKTQLFE